MFIDAETNLIVIEIIHRVKVAQEGVTDEINIVHAFYNRALVANVAQAFLNLNQVGLGLQVESVAAHQKWDGFQVLNCFAVAFNDAHDFLTLQFRAECSLPLLDEKIKHFFWHHQQRRSSVNYCGDRLVRDFKVFPVENAWAAEAPHFQLIMLNIEEVKVARNLCFVDASKSGVWLLTKLLVADRKADDCLIDRALVA